MTHLFQRTSLLFLAIALSGILALPSPAKAVTPTNLTTSSWILKGNVDVTNNITTLQEQAGETAYAYQDVAVSRTMGNRLLLVSYTKIDQPRANGDITGLPYLYGYAMNSQGKILSYLQSSTLRSTSTGSWTVTSSLFSVPRNTTTVRLFLKQASKKGTLKDGRTAQFTQPGIFVARTSEELQSVVQNYKDRLGTLSLLPPTTSPLPATPNFDIIYNGYGSVSLGSVLTLSPKASTEPGETHAALVTSKATYAGNYETRFTMTSTSQLRTGSSPNPWETGWFVFGYKPDAMFKYLILKPNGYGIELGESLGNDRQNFLWTSIVGADTFLINRSYDVRVRVENRVITLFVDGIQRLSYSLSSRDLLSTDGKVGFYSEDANVKIENVSVRQL